MYGVDWSKPNKDWKPFIMDRTALKTGLHKFLCLDLIIGNWENGRLDYARKSAELLCDIYPGDASVALANSCLNF